VQQTYGARKDVYDEVHSINAMCFHPSGTFMTAGSDGVYIMWDKDEKSRLQKPNPGAHLPITAASYNSSGSLLAYALGYDWGQGHAHYDPSNAQHKPAIMLHKLLDAEYQRRPKGRR
jgi:mRNA export factor